MKCGLTYLCSSSIIEIRLYFGHESHCLIVSSGFLMQHFVLCGVTLYYMRLDYLIRKVYMII